VVFSISKWKYSSSVEPRVMGSIFAQVDGGHWLLANSRPSRDPSLSRRTFTHASLPIPSYHRASAPLLATLLLVDLCCTQGFLSPPSLLSLLAARRDVCDAQHLRVRREPAPIPQKPPRRSNRACAAGNSQVGGHIEMPRAEVADESKTEDDWILGKSLTPLCLVLYGVCCCCRHM